MTEKDLNLDFLLPNRSKELGSICVRKANLGFVPEVKCSKN
jgi:hypothetical protein